MLGACIGLCGSSIGKGREEVKQTSFRFPSLLTLSSSWQESASLVQLHYPICTICETKGAVGLEVPVAVTGLSNVRRTFPRFSVSLGQKEEHQQGLYSIPPKKSHWELWGDFGEKKF